MENKDAAKAQLVIVTGFIVLFAITKRIVFIDIALGVALLSLLFPYVGDLIVKGWYKLSDILGWVNSRIILSLMYFLFLTPISICYRLFTKKGLNNKPKDVSSFYFVRNHKYTKEDIENTW